MGLAVSQSVSMLPTGGIVDVTHWMAILHNRASQHASGDVSHWVQGAGYAQYEASNTKPVSGDATH